MKMTKTHDSGERGQMLVMLTLLLPVMLGFVALTMDVGLALLERTNLQNAVDAAALAAAQELPDSEAARAVAEQYLETNGFDIADSTHDYAITTPYLGNPGKIEVIIGSDVGFVFGRVLDLDFVEVKGRAVAEISDSGGSAPAIFAMNDDCSAADPLLLPGSDLRVVGGVHSNSSIGIAGSNNDFDGQVTYSCDLDNSGSNNTFSPPPRQASNRPPPIDYAYSDFLCDYEWTGDTDLSSHPEVWVDGDPGTNELLPGVYCSTDDLILNGQYITGTVSLIAGDELKISGSDFNISSFVNDVLAYSSGNHNSAIDMSGSGGSWIGFVHAPLGRAKVQGSSNLSISGSVVAAEVTVSGSNFSITSFDDSQDPISYVRLVE